MEIVIYTKSGCPYCTKAKNWFKKQGIDYSLRIINNDVKRQRFYDDCGNGVNTMPQIFVDDVRIGGWKDLLNNAEYILSEFGGLMTVSKTFKPFLYPKAVELSIEHENDHWTEHQVELSDDVNQWKNGDIAENAKNFIIHIQRLFTQSDVEVAANYYNYFIPKIKNNEFRNLLGSIAGREAIHQRAYALFSETLGLPDGEFHAFLEYKEMSDKVDFIQDNNSNTFSGFAQAIAKTIFTEGVSLFASFAMLLNFQRSGHMIGYCKIIEWSIRDENLHVQAMTLLYRTFCEEHPKIVTKEFIKQIRAMVRKLVRLEDVFIDSAFDGHDFNGFTADECKQYIRLLADRRLIGMGLDPEFGVKDNPIPWLEWIINAADHTNFFENRVTDYDVGGSVGTWDYDDLSDLDEKEDELSPEMKRLFAEYHH